MGGRAASARSLLPPKHPRRRTYGSKGRRKLAVSGGSGIERERGGGKGEEGRGGLTERYAGNLVDSASSHTLVSKIKPCMSKYKRLYSETANGSLYQS